MESEKGNSLCEQIINENRLFLILNEKLLASKFFEVILYKRIIDFIDSYLGFHKLTPKEATKHYLDFIKSYNKDVRHFAKTKQYPLEVDDQRQAPSRIAYNIVLLFSTIFNAHRFRIMQIIDSNTIQGDNALFIGCGPGLEIDLVRNKTKNLLAYDLTLDDALGELLPDVHFKNEFFDGSNAERFDNIYLIEILEHLEDPFILLQNCKKVLGKNGLIYLTTATDIPQFDHLYNFPSDHVQFDQKIKEMGFEIQFEEDIHHDSMTVDVMAKNKFYILKNIN